MNTMFEDVYKIYPHCRCVPESKLVEWVDTYKCRPTLSNEEYFNIHKAPLTPLNIKIDVEEFLVDISKFSDSFSEWGSKHTKFRRFGIPLVNMTGTLNEVDDPSRQPLDEMFARPPHRIVHDTDVRVPTEVMNLKSLIPLSPITKYMIRSAILLWHNLSHFKPHADVFLPAPNLRLWGTTSRKIFLKMGGEEITNIEPGRLYLFDSSIIHEAISYDDNLYQFFLALDINSYSTIKKLLCNV